MKFAKEKSCFVIEIDPKIGFLREDKEDLQTGTADKDQLEKAKIRQENIDGLKHFFQKEIIDSRFTNSCIALSSTMIIL